MTRAEIDAELEGYRDPPKDIEYREHHPACEWCVFYAAIPDYKYCENPINNPTGRWSEASWVSNLNGDGQCERYRPNLWTRALQLVRIRPFVSRSS